MLIAQVIVDVPTMQTDQAYSYLIPENLSDVVSVGMRVEVPFGNGNRHIQGFVLAIEQVHPEKITQDKIELKPLIRCLDLQPVLNDELLQLAANIIIYLWQLFLLVHVARLLFELCVVLLPFFVFDASTQDLDR